VLKRRDDKLQEQALHLEETNTALKVLLRSREEDRKGLEKTLLTNIQTLILPYIEKLRCKNLTDKQAAYLGMIESNLAEIISPFVQKINNEYARFTPTEIQIANMIKNGNSSKQMAELLNISKGTVDGHRNNIRKKLGLQNKKANLQIYLRSL
jgi:DNA-binding CsgD family transcriptional regulator